jgi:hypothetical protein
MIDGSKKSMWPIIDNVDEPTARTGSHGPFLMWPVLDLASLRRSSCQGRRRARTFATPPPPLRVQAERIHTMASMDEEPAKFDPKHYPKGINANFLEGSTDEVSACLQWCGFKVAARS